MRFDRRKTYPLKGESNPKGFITDVISALTIIPTRVNGIIKNRGRGKIPINVAVGKMTDRTQWKMPFRRMTVGGASDQFGHVPYNTSSGGGGGPFDNYPEPLSQPELDALTAFYDAEVAAGNWDKYEGFYALGLQSPVNSIFNPILGVSGYIDQEQAPVHLPGDGYEFRSNEIAFDGTAIDLLYDSDLYPPASGMNPSNVFWSIYQLSGGYPLSRNKSVISSFNYPAAFVFSLSTDGPGAVSISSNGGELFSENSGLTGIDQLVTSISSATDSSMYIDGVLDVTQPVTPASIKISDMSIGQLNNENSNALAFDGIAGLFIFGAGEGLDFVSHNTNIRTLVTALAAI